MNHLDEGTIHAWIDGALDATQSAEIEAHIKVCAECSAKVAEARGLVAASSRILVSLDDTPSNVTPRSVVAPVRRRWNATPWVSGLAAAAVLLMLWQTGGVEQPTPMAEIRVPEIPAISVPEPTLAPVESPRPRLAKAPPPRLERQQARVGNVSGAEAAHAPPVATEEPQRREAFASEALLRARSDSATVQGCYRVALLDEVVVTGVGAAQKSVAADMATPIAVIRLDSGNVIRRPAASDSVIGTWVAIAGDSARVVMGGQMSLVGQSSKVRCP